MYLKLLSGPRFCSLWVLLASTLILSNCSGGALSFLTGGGPNVAANTQLGKENSQTLGVSNSSSSEQSITRPQARDIRQTSDNNNVNSENTESIIYNENPPLWVWLLLIVGWLAPSPSEIGRSITGLFKRKD